MDIRKLAVRLINSVIPKNNKSIIFTSNPDFSDNTLAVFEAIRKDERFSGYKLTWITRESSLSEYKGTKCYKVNGLKSFVVYFRAKYVFTTHGLYYGTRSKSQFKVGLWHGMPLKSLGFFTSNSEKYSKTISEESFDFKYMIATSPLYREIMAKCFRLKEEAILVSGQPRNDELFHKDDSLAKMSIFGSDKVVCWLPTYRNPKAIGQERGIYNQGKNYEFGIPLINSDNVAVLNRCLCDAGVKMIIKIHGTQKFDKETFPEASNIKIITNEDLYIHDVQLYNLLACSDALVTDYSSAYIDYLATDKPMAFIVDDINEYGTDRGFVFDNPLDYMPGKKVKTMKALMEFICDVGQNKDNFKQERREARKLLNIFTDDNNTNRVVDFIFKQ